MQTFDIRDTLIPFSLLQICNHFNRMDSGDVVEIICSDLSIEKDMKKILPKRNCRITIGKAHDGKAGSFCILMRKI